MIYKHVVNILYTDHMIHTLLGLHETWTLRSGIVPYAESRDTNAGPAYTAFIDECIRNNKIRIRQNQYS